MAKLLIIDACDCCPFYKYGACANDETIYTEVDILDDNVIPEWCPLEDAPNTPLNGDHGQRVKTITDLSDTIHINDGMDD